MQSLLFCPDEKSARALTPVVEGLQVVLVRETEVYSAMRRLMAESFDFLIVDCEDEPTGRLILKNAHGSAMNKGALAVAVVARETGANALRFGADFLITKPVVAEEAGKVIRRVRSSILRRQPSSPQEKTAQPIPVTSVATPTSQSSNLELAAPVITPAEERPVEALSEAQAATSIPMIEVNTSKIDVNPPPEPNQPNGNSRSENDQESHKEEVLIELPLSVATEKTNRTSTMEIETTIAEKAVTESGRLSNEVGAEIKTKKARPRLSMLAVAAAVGMIVFIVVVIAWHIDFEHSLMDGRTPVQSSTSPSTVPPNTKTDEAQMRTSAAVDSTPNTSFGTNSVTGDKASNAPQLRTVKVNSSGKSSTGMQMAASSSTVSVSSNPSAAALWVDGSDTGRMTPTQIVVDKPGSHTFVFKKQGYLDETIATNLRMGQTFHLAPSLRALGRTDEIKMAGPFSKVFGGRATAEMGTVRVKTQPKGAQITVNARVLGKASPAEFYLNPGNYAIDIALSGFKMVHRVVSVDKGGKVAIDEVMDRE